MSTDQQHYSIDSLTFMARMHRVDYYQFVLEELKPIGQERSLIVGSFFARKKRFRISGNWRA
jgi:hypothetical protein